MRIKSELLTLLTSGTFESFTATELTKAYLQIPVCHSLDGKTARQFILRNIHRLKKNKLIEKIGKQSGRSMRFRFTQNFNAANVVKGSNHITVEDNQSDQFIKNLKLRYQQSKLDLLTAIGEVEEYESIIKESPQQKNHVQVLYNEARDLCSKTLGRVRALETLISSQPSI